jgi:hypothetical protein
MFFTFPEDARSNAEREAVEFGVEIGVFKRAIAGPAHARSVHRSLLRTPNSA